MNTHRILPIVAASLSGATVMVGLATGSTIALGGLLAGGVVCGTWLVHQLIENRRRVPIPVPKAPPNDGG